LGRVPARTAPDTTTRSVCGFCSTGCSLDIHLKDGSAVNLSPTSDYPVNLGMACPKGWEALTPLAAPDRGTTPQLRENGGRMHPTDWHTALTQFCVRMKDIQQRHGPHSIAFLSTGQICTEEMALLGCLFKFGMGGLHCDSNTRQCMATTHVAYKQSFGFDAPPFTYADFEEGDVLVFVGANPCIAHPILWQRVMRNPHRPEIIVVDPRKTETAMAATQHYALRPKSDLTLLYGVANRLLALGALKREFVDAHTVGFDAFAEFLQHFGPERVATETGLSHEQLDRFAGTIARGRRVSFWWTMGVNQGHQATRTAQAIINLALMTGNIGKPGTGPNSITGQCNAMGSRIFSNITGLIGGREFSNEAHRAQVSALLGVPGKNIPAVNSWAYDQMVQGIRDDKIKGLWVIATNGSHSWIHQDEFNKVLAKLDFLVVQDLYPTIETAQRAHLYLPAAGWGEKEGTLINSERRIGLVKKVAPAPGQALSDFNIFRLVAEYWGCGEMFNQWSSPEAVFQILKDLSRGQPCDISGIRDYRMIDESGGIQWPFSEAFASQVSDSEAQSKLNGRQAGLKSHTERRLFENGKFYHVDHKAKFLFEEPQLPAELPDARFPFVLLTGRGTSAQWHTGSRTNKSAVLRALAPPGCYVELNPADAGRLGIAPNTRVRVTSRRASLLATAFITPTVQRGQLFIPMHYPEANRLTCSSFDPHSRQPSYKYCAVHIQPAG
jgi:assimilatory nitrate reductase catalytic subunit